MLFIIVTVNFIDLITYDESFKHRTYDQAISFFVFSNTHALLQKLTPGMSIHFRAHPLLTAPEFFPFHVQIVLTF